MITTNGHIRQSLLKGGEKQGLKNGVGKERGRGRGRKGGTELRGTSKAEARVGHSVHPQSLPPPTRQRIHTTHVRRGSRTRSGEDRVPEKGSYSAASTESGRVSSCLCEAG